MNNLFGKAMGDVLFNIGADTYSQKHPMRGRGQAYTQNDFELLNTPPKPFPLVNPPNIPPAPPLTPGPPPYPPYRRRRVPAVYRLYLRVLCQHLIAIEHEDANVPKVSAGADTRKEQKLEHRATPGDNGNIDK
jgi:hypothetical protein